MTLKVHIEKVCGDIGDLSIDELSISCSSELFSPRIPKISDKTLLVLF
jgi:hypothetical protein